MKKRLKEMNHFETLLKNKDVLSRKAFERDPEATNYFRTYIENQVDSSSLGLQNYSGGFPVECIFD